MTALRVWAPNAARVDVVCGDDRVALAEAGDGWFQLAAGVPPGTAYAFSLDGGPPLPDPRAPSLPAGVHGPARAVDHDAFRWRDEDWGGFDLTGAVLYELHVGTFTPEGTFDAVVERLPHLVDLGVTAIEIMPVAQFPGRNGWGYDGVGLYAAHHAYGGSDGLKRLVDAAHDQGVGVVLDVVYNHLGPVGNHLSQFGPYFTDRHTTPWGDAVNLDDPGSDEVRALIIDNAIHWLRDHHLDGLRLDAVHAIIDTSPVHILEAMAEAVDDLAARVGRTLHLIAETDRFEPRIIRPRPDGGYGLDAEWCDDIHHAMHVALTGERDGYYARYRGTMSEIAAAWKCGHLGDGAAVADGRRIVASLQNHDQVGNRAKGERTSHLISPARRKVGAALLLTSPFTPMLFQGEEWSASSPFLYFTDYEDRALGAAISEGRRSEFAAFGWSADEVPDPQDPSTFERSALRWEERCSGEHAEAFDWHRSLIALRRATPDLLDDRLSLVGARPDDAARTLVIERGTVSVACNLSPSSARLPVRPGRLLLASDPAVSLDGDHVHLPPDTAVVLQTS